MKAIVAAALADAADMFKQISGGYIGGSVSHCVFWLAGRWASRGYVSPLGLALWFFPCLWCMPYEASMAPALGALGRAVRRLLFTHGTQKHHRHWRCQH